MKIVAVASNGVLVRKRSGPELVPLGEFLTAEQKKRLENNQKCGPKIYAQLRKRLEAKVVR